MDVPTFPALVEEPLSCQSPVHISYGSPFLWESLTGNFPHILASQQGLSPEMLMFFTWELFLLYFFGSILLSFFSVLSFVCLLSADTL